MPTEQEELRLTITLVDQASVGLESIKAHWEQLTTGPAAAHMETFRRKQSEIGEQIKKISEAATGGERAMLAFVGKMGLAGFAVAKITELAGEGVKALAEYDASVTNLANRARAIGVQSGVLKGIEEQMETFGISVADADKTVKGLNDAITEMSQQGSQRRQKLIASALDSKEMEASLDNLKKLTDETERINAVRVEGLKVRHDWEEKTGDKKLAQAKERQFYEGVGTDANVIRNLRQLHEITQAEIDLQDKRDENAAIQLEHIVALRQEWQHWMDDIKASFGWLNPLVDTLKKGLEFAHVFGAAAGNTLPELLAAYQRALAVELPELLSKGSAAFPPGNVPAPGAPLPLLSPGNVPAPLRLLEQGSPDTGRDYFHTLKENTSQLKKLNDKLDVNMATRGGGIPGPGAGATPGGGGGETTAGGGGDATPGGGAGSPYGGLGGVGTTPGGETPGGATPGSIGTGSSAQFGQLGGLSPVTPSLGSIAGQGFAGVPLTPEGRGTTAGGGGDATPSHGAGLTPGGRLGGAGTPGGPIGDVLKMLGGAPITKVFSMFAKMLDGGGAHDHNGLPTGISQILGQIMQGSPIASILRDPTAVLTQTLQQAKRVGIHGLRGTAAASHEAPEEDRQTIDAKRVKTVKVEATGKVGVNISRGQDFTLGSKRQFFKPTAPERQTQMIPAETGPTAVG
jgi:hypothetical protein